MLKYFHRWRQQLFTPAPEKIGTTKSSAISPDVLAIVERLLDVRVWREDRKYEQPSRFGILKATLASIKLRFVNPSSVVAGTGALDVLLRTKAWLHGPAAMHNLLVLGTGALAPLGLAKGLVLLGIEVRRGAAPLTMFMPAPVATAHYSPLQSGRAGRR